MTFVLLWTNRCRRRDYLLDRRLARENIEMWERWERMMTDSPDDSAKRGRCSHHIARRRHTIEHILFRGRQGGSYRFRRIPR